MLNTAVRMTGYVLVALLFITATGCAKAIDTKEHGAIATVKEYLSAKTNNDYPALVSTLANDPGSFPLGVITLTSHRFEVADAETLRIKRYYTGSDLALKAGWSNEYIKDHMIVVLAVYTVQYDNTKVPYEGGTTLTYFHLIREHASSPWLIWQSYRARAGN